MDYTTLREDFRTYLQLEYAKRCKMNPQYSLRAFAKKLDIDASSLSQFLRNKRNLSENKMKTIGKKLDLSAENFLKYVSNSDSKNYQLIKLDHFSLLSDWYHLAICQMSLLSGFMYNSKWIAKRLNITVTQAQGAVERLIRLGWMEEVEDTLRFVGGNLSTIDKEITTEALKDFQKQMLVKATDAIDTVDLKHRSNTGMTMAINKDKLPQAQAMINQFRRKICDFLEDTDHKDEVYHLSISLIPLTQIEEQL
jgi:uncharacterized protein (TIGR02147 family)